ncbi:hypothetical protein ABIC08_008389 [Bradyrhizobium sp. RT9b]|uniref:hypothetical protein n=1 Tax=Bradyrhizobium sp. RT9b TaxID=3156385 RepID=UPI003393EC71
MSLALASWGLTSFTKGSSAVARPADLLVFTAPVVIVLVTVSVWACDFSLISKSTAHSPGTIKLAKWLRCLMPLSTSVLIACLAVASYVGALPEGLLPGTLWISASVCALLVIISIRRWTVSNMPTNHAGLTLALAAIALLIGAAIWFSSRRLGDLVGSLNVCLFAFGAALAILNLFGLVAGGLINASLLTERVKFAGTAIAFLLLLAGLTSMIRDFHRVRLCAIDPCSAAPALKASLKFSPRSRPARSRHSPRLPCATSGNSHALKPSRSPEDSPLADLSRNSPIASIEYGL